MKGITIDDETMARNISLRLSERDFSLIELAAQRLQLPPSTFIRRAAVSSAKDILVREEEEL